MGWSGGDGGKGKGRRDGERSWGGRHDDRRDLFSEPKMQQHHHTLDAEGGSKMTDPITDVELDALVVLQIMKHCRQHAPFPVTGQLLGMDVDDTLQVTHSFGYVQRSNIDDRDENVGEEYQMGMMKKLREVNVDTNTVGWYQSTHLGSFFSQMAIDTQFQYQTDIPRSVLLVYDPLQSAIGKPAFKALQLSREFMKVYAATPADLRGGLVDFPSGEMFVEKPISVGSSAIIESFLVDWAICDPMTTTSQVAILDVENQVFLEKNVQLLMGSLADLAEEQNKLLQFERQANRKGDNPQKGGRDRFQRNVGPPRQLDTMILSQQIKTYCKAIDSFAADAFGKIYLMSNKPAGSAKAKA